MRRSAASQRFCRGEANEKTHDDIHVSPNPKYVSLRRRVNGWSTNDLDCASVFATFYISPVSFAPPVIVASIVFVTSRRWAHLEAQLAVH